MKEVMNFKPIVNFLFEAGVLAKTPRSGFQLLGSGEQTVAEHTNRVVFIGYVLAMLDGEADMGKVLKICLFHDFAEARVSDLNYLHLKYVEKQEEKALEETVKDLPFGVDIKNIFKEYQERETKEALIAKEADILEWILSLKEQADIGNARALEWITVAQKRLNTDQGRILAHMIVETDSNEWWGSDLDDPWWIKRRTK